MERNYAKLSPKDNDVILQSKKLSALLRGITSKHHGDIYCLNCFRSFATKSKLQSHKTVCENKDFCNIIMPSEDTKMLEFNQYQKSDKALFIIYDDLECLIEKIDGCKNHPGNCSLSKVSEHIPSGFSMSTISSFKSIENKYDVCRDKDCMKRFYEFLREHAMKVINSKKKIWSAAGIIRKYKKICYICKKNWKLIFER